MKLKYKFTILISGIILVPLMITSLIIYINAVIETRDEPVPRYFSIMSWLVNTFPGILESEFENSKEIEITPPPEGIFFILIDPDSKIVLSNLEKYKTGLNINFKDAVGLLLEENSDYRLVTEYWRFKERNEDGILIFGIKKISIQIDEGLFKIKQAVYIFIGLIIVFSIAGILFVNSVIKGIISLERATQRIASGDLDFELKIKGTDEISSLEKSFNVMREKLKAEMEKRSRFLMAVSHDLSTPLTSIKGYVEAIQDGYAESKEELEKYISIIHDKTDLLAWRINELIDFVKMETGEWKMKLKNENLKELLISVAKIYKNDTKIFKRDFKYNINVPDNIEISVDKNLLLRALENLLNNAVRYTEEKDKILLNANLSDIDNKIHLKITDSGAGIPQDEIKNIFVPFYRGTNFNNKKGFGIGLSSVKSIVESHGWSIEVKSELKIGTTFNIRIPV